MRYETQTELRRAAEKKLERTVNDSDWSGAAFETGTSSWGPYDDGDRDALVNYLRERGYSRPQKTVEDFAQAWQAYQERVRLTLSLDGPVQQRIREFRRRVWDTPEPPFAGGPEAAAEWIEAEVQALGEISLSERVLKWTKADGSLGFHAVPARGRLAELYGLAELVVKLVDCRHAEAVEYILTGKVPEVEPVSAILRRSTGTGKFHTGEVVITIKTPDVSPEQVAEVYKRARKAVWGMSRSAPASELDAELANFALQEEDKSLRRWNREHEKKVDAPETLRKKLERALQRIVKPPK